MGVRGAFSFGNQRDVESLLGSLAQPLLTVGHRTQLARQADFAESDHLLGDGFVGKTRRQRERYRQIAGGFRDFEPAHQIHEDVVLLQRNAGVTIHHG